jgi:hypothetical protein
VSCAAWVSRIAACAFATAVASGAAFAQWTDHIALKGLQDIELFETDDNSRLLSKNQGEAGGAGRLRLWAAADFTGGFQGMFVGRAEGGSDADTQADVEQALIRFTAPQAHLMVEAGRIIYPVGNFSKRYLSTVNPLIGGPDSYDVTYPEGIVLTGKVAFFDYRAGALDRPIANAKYMPESSRAWRPVAGIGFTPMMGLRIGAYYTQGPYMGEGIQSMLLPGESWKDYEEEIAGVELEFSRGYFELNGDIAFSAYDVPTRPSRSRGQAWYLEPKYTWTPRFFTALRLEKNDYPYIAPINPYFWLGDGVTFHDVEVGAGWRFTPDLVIKASYRADHWDVETPADKAFFPNGYAFGLQLSYAFDIRSWFDPLH